MAVRRIVRGVIITLLVGLILAVPSAAWASGAQTAGAVAVSGQALEQELQQAVRQGLSEAEAGRLAYELRGIKDPFVKPSWWTASSFNSRQLARAEAARGSLKQSYGLEVDLARGGLERSLRGFSDLVFQARARGIEVGDFAQQVEQYRAYAGQASTISEFRDLSVFLAPKGEQVRQLVAEFNRESDAANSALADARAALADARAFPTLQIDVFGAAIDAVAGEMAKASTVGELRSASRRLAEQRTAVRDLLDMRAAAFGALEQAQATLRRAQEAKVDTAEAAAVIASQRARLAAAGTSDEFSNIAWRLGQQRRSLENAIWLASLSAGGAPGPGKLIDISLSRQQLVLYQDGSALFSTIITTGRPGLPTPPGNYTIMAKYSPYRMISPWPYGHPYWYPPSDMSYAMLFRGGGYFIHDAPWRSIWGSPGVDGSHGCVNVPGGAMGTVWAFADIGTQVVVHW